MKQTSFLTGALALILSACSDGVPNVSDPHKVVVNGKPMTQQAFLEKYCMGKTTSETCNKVAQAMSMDSLRGQKVPGWVE